MATMEVVDKDEIDPLCPHCEKQLRTVWSRKLGGLLGTRFVYFCSNCRKVLGISHRKGFWMG